MESSETKPEAPPPRSFSVNTRWRAIGNGGGNGLRYVTYILLSAILGPAEMGRMALALVVVEILDSLKGAGIGQLVIQRRELGGRFLDSIATLQLLVVMMLASALLLGAGGISDIMDEQSIEPIVQVMTGSLVLSGLSFVHQNLLARELRFDSLAKIEIIQAAAYSVIALTSALCGAGVWSMVVGHLVREGVAAIAYWHLSGYRTRLAWDNRVIRESLGFALSIMGSTVLNATMSRVDQIIVGRLLGKEALGIYALAKRLILYPTRILGMLLNTVLLSTISRMADDHVEIRRLYLRVCTALAVLAFPAVFGLAAVSQPFTDAILDDRWQSVGLLLPLLSPAGAIQVLTITTMSLFVSQGRPDLLLKWSFVHYACVTAAFTWAANVSIDWVPVAESGVMILLAAPTFILPFRLVGLRLVDLFRAIRSPLFASLAMGVSVYLGVQSLEAAGWDAWTCLIVGALGGVVLYLAIMISVARSTVVEVWSAATRRTRSGPV